MYTVECVGIIFGAAVLAYRFELLGAQRQLHLTPVLGH